MRKIIILLTLILSLNVFSQEQLNFALVEKKTYDYYLSGGWVALIDLGNKAIKADIDYYYLNYRMGIAYYQVNKYMLSAYFFEKALNQNSGAYDDSLLVSTLYLDYIYSKNFTKAEGIKSHHSDKDIANLKFIKPVSSLYFEGGSSFSDDISTKAYQERKYYFYKQIDLFKKMNYYSADIQGYILPNLKYQVAFSGLQIERYKFYKEIPDTFEQNFTLYQNYFFLGLNYSFDKFYIKPAFNLVSYQSNELNIVAKDSIINRNIYDTISQKANDFVASIEAGINYKNIKAGLAFSFSNILQGKQFQLATDFIYFPNGNFDTYLTSQISGLWENGVSYMIVKQKIGMKLTDFLWSELSLTVGNLTNYNSNNGYYVYNTRDNLKSIAGLNFIILLSKHLEMNIVFQNLLKENYMLSYPNTLNQTIEKTNYYFQQLNIIGGIKWTF